jgi:hypothetical protein
MQFLTVSLSMKALFHQTPASSGDPTTVAVLRGMVKETPCTVHNL